MISLKFASSNIFITNADVVLCLQLQLPLVNKQLGARGYQRGDVVIVAEELTALKDEVVMQFSGVRLDKKDFFGKSDPFLVFHKSMESGDYVVVHKTEVCWCHCLEE